MHNLFYKVMDIMEQWKDECTPWKTIVEMGHLTNLIYDYAKHWKINELNN